MSHDLSRFIGRKELADAMGVSKYTILRWTKSKAFPKPLPNSGRTPIYDLQEIEEWLRISPKTEYAETTREVPND